MITPQAPLPETIRVRRDWLDGGWVAEVLEKPGCMAQGETEIEAVRNVVQAYREVLEVGDDE